MTCSDSSLENSLLYRSVNWVSFWKDHILHVQVLSSTCLPIVRVHWIYECHLVFSKWTCFCSSVIFWMCSQYISPLFPSHFQEKIMEICITRTEGFCDLPMSYEVVWQASKRRQRMMCIAHQVSVAAKQMQELDWYLFKVRNNWVKKQSWKFSCHQVILKVA